jgi:hypothetical protein
MIVVIVIIVYRISHIKGCKFGLINRILEPNLFKENEMCSFPVIQKVLEIEHIPNKINEYLTLMTSQGI